LFLLVLFVVNGEDVTINSDKVITTIDDRFVSAGWEMWAYLGLIPKLSDPVIRKAVSHLGPGSLRVGGITCDFVTYVLPTGMSKRDTMQFWPNYTEPLSIADFEALVDFANASNLALLFGLNELTGRNCHVNGNHCDGNWDTSNVVAFLKYIRDNKIGPIVGFELGNELTNAYDLHLTIQENAADYNVLNTLISQIWPDKADRPLIYGPSTDYCNDDSAIFMNGTKSFLSGFTYHSYPGQGGSDLKTQLVDINWLKQNIILNDPHAHSAICIQNWEQIGKPIGMELWVTETSSSYNNVVGVLDTFYNGFWYSASLGQYASTGVKRHSIWSFMDDSAFSYINITQPTITAHADYWVAILHKHLIGTKVLQVTSAFNQILVYAHCGKTAGSVALIVINPASTSVSLNLSGLNSLQRDEYILTADSLDSYVVKLNGRELYIGSDGSLPPLNGVSASGQTTLPPYSYGYIVFPNGGGAC